MWDFYVLNDFSNSFFFIFKLSLANFRPYTSFFDQAHLVTSRTGFDTTINIIYIPNTHSQSSHCYENVALTENFTSLDTKRN